MNQCNGNLTAVPSADTVGSVQAGEWDMQFFQPFGYAGEVVLEPVSNKNRLSVCRFDDVLQSIELSVMDLNDFAVIIVNSTVCHLRQLAGERSGISGGDFGISEG